MASKIPIQTLRKITKISSICKSLNSFGFQANGLTKPKLTHPFSKQPGLVDETFGNYPIATFSTFSHSIPRMESMIVKVPTMGDSITEGTIVEWTVEIGQAVKEGDVVALVETDKVTVDIKAEADGVMIAQFGAVEDTIEVGADLYKIDTEATASVIPDSDSSSSTSTTTETNTTTTTTTSSSSSSEPISISTATSTDRVPSIQFLGKAGWKNRRESNHAEVETSENEAIMTQTNTMTIIDMEDPMYGRPAFSEEEMEALILGGANLAPKLESASSGAVFR